MSEPVILAGQEIDVDALTKRFTDVPDQVEVLLPAGPGEMVKLIFRSLPRKSEADLILSEARRYYNAHLAKGCPGKVHPWAEFWPQSLQEYVDARLIADLSVDPVLPIETTLKWQRNPTMVRSIMEQIEAQSKTVATQWLVAMTEEKKSDSGSTSSDAA